MRLNIRPFMTAGILRAEPNIKWGVDRGTNPDGSKRDNDVHLTVARKRAAQEAKKVEHESSLSLGRSTHRNAPGQA